MGLSKRQKRKRGKPPRLKRMKRPARLQSAKRFLATFEGENVLRGYCKHFGVDWRCAAIELKQLGVEINSEYLGQRELTENAKTAQRQRRRNRQRTDSQQSNESFPMTAFDAWLDEDYALHDALSQSQEDALESSSMDDIPF